MKTKKFLSTLLALVMVLGLFPVTAMADGTNEAQIGDTTYATFKEAVSAIQTDGSDTTIKLLTDVDVGEDITFQYGTGTVTFTADQPVTVKQTATETDFDFTDRDSKNMRLVVDENVTIEVYDNSSGMYLYYGPSLVLNGTITGGQNWGVLYLFQGTHTVSENGKVGTGRLQLGYTDMTVQGEVDTNYLLVEASTFTADGAKVDAGVIYDNNNGGQRWGKSKFDIKNNSDVTTNSLTLSYADSVLTIDMSSKLNAKTITGAGKIVIDATGYQAGDACPIVGDASAFTGTIEVVNGDLIAEVTDTGAIELKEVVAKIGEVSYTSLAAAVEDAQTGDTVTLLADVALDAPITVAAGKTVTLDLNGKTISQTKAQTGNYQMILNDGNLTIKDSVGGGKISYTDTVGGNFVSNAITNRGTLTLKSGTVENLSAAAVAAAGFPYAIDTSIWGEADAVNTVIEGGKVYCESYSALRLRADSETEPVNVTITGGEVWGRIEVQNPTSNKATIGKLTISDNAVINKNNSSKAIMIFGGGGTAENLKAEISGGTITGEIGYSSSFPITGFDEKVITGGTFSADPTTYVADDYIAKKNSDTEYVVVARSGLTSGTYMADPTGATATYYYVTNNNDGTWTVYYSAPSSDSGSSSSSNTTSTTTKNDDGSTTTTTTNKTTGTVTETTKNTDGSTTTVETKKDGTVTTTEKTADGVTGTVMTDEDGTVTEVTATVPTAAANAAAKADEPVTLPVEVPAAASSEEAVEISVNVPSKGATVEIPVENVTPGTVVVIVKKDGTETIVPTSTLTEDGVVVTLEEDATIKVIDNSKDFTDVADDYALSDSIDFVSARGLFEGTTETTFNPHANTTVAQTMTVLARLSGEDFYGAGSTTKGAEWAAEKGLDDGTPVHQAVTRQQMVVMMWKLAGSPDSDHPLNATDSHEISDHAMTAMRWAVEMGILKGNLDGTINPHGNASRAHVAAFAERYVNAIA